MQEANPSKTRFFQLESYRNISTDWGPSQPLYCGRISVETVAALGVIVAVASFLFCLLLELLWPGRDFETLSSPKDILVGGQSIVH